MSEEGENAVQATAGGAESAKNTEQVEKAGADTGKAAETEADDRPKKDGMQRRIDRLTRDKYELKARLELLERMQQDNAPQHRELNRNAFDSDEDYLEALAEKKAAEKVQARESERMQKQVSKIIAEAEKLGDFDREDFADVRITQTMSEAIIDSDIAPRIVHYLNANPDEADRIADMPKSRQAAAIGKLEAKLEAEKPEKKAAKTSAPDPIKPVSSKNAGGGYHPGMSFAEYAKMRGSRLYR